MLVDFIHDGVRHSRFPVAEAHERGVPAAVVGAAAKVEASRRVSEFANSYRARLASASPGKLQAYRIKEEIARDQAGASAEELALIDREATARGLTRAELLVEIAAKAAAYRQIALLIEALEAETGAAIAGIPDDAADIEAQIGAVLLHARTEAETEFAAAIVLINGA